MGSRKQLEEVTLCQLLNALRQIRRLPGTSPTKALLRLREQVKQLPPTEKTTLVRLAHDYNPATRPYWAQYWNGWVKPS